jgi:hypothetical protein
VEARLTRLAKNEALFREVNERISEISQELAPGSPNPELIDGLVCECSDPQCLEKVGPLTITEYEGVRKDPTRFIMPLVIRRRTSNGSSTGNQATGWSKKHEGPPSEVARERDPRS